MKNNDNFYLTIPLVKFIEKDVDYSGNYLVYGEGGFGKTTSMILVFGYLLNKAKNGENIVPIYIDSKGLDFTYDKPVFEYIIREYCGLNKDISNHIETLNYLLKNSDKKYYIIIDAINEAESNKYKVIRDIASLKEIFDKNHAGRLIVSSRTDENVYCFNNFKRIKMLNFTDEQIVGFLNKDNLKNKGKSIDKIDVERIDENLMKLLRVPMFLKIFKDVYKDEDGFSDLYTENIVRESDMLGKFIDKIIDDKIGIHKAEESPEYRKCFFALKRFLPALAFELAKNNKFSISESGLDDLFENKFSESYFKQFQNRRENYFKYAGNLDDLLNDCIDDFSFIVCKGENKNIEYSFSHHAWRDYFSALHLANSIDYDVASEFEYQISNNIQQYIGEIIKEYEFENKTDVLSEMSPIEAFMQRNRNVLSPLAVRLCVEIMKKSRNGNLTAKYNNPDFLQNLDKTSMKNKKAKKGRKKNFRPRNIKRVLPSIIVAVFVIIAVPIMIFIFNNSRTVTIGEESFKSNTTYVRFEEGGKKLTKEDIEKITQLSDVSSVNLDDCELPDNAVCELLKMDLSYLSLNNCGIVDSDFDNLIISNDSAYSLKINDNSIANLNVLIPLSEHIKELYIDNNPVSDISALETLNLNVLSLNSTGLSDVSPLAKITNLRELYIDDNNIETLTPLNNCEGIQIISVNNNKLSNFSGLEHSLKLAEVYAQSNNINSLEGLENATILSTVNLNDNVLIDISVLSKSKETLTNLYVDNNNISDIGCLSECANIKLLHINNNYISSLDALSKCAVLENISAKNNSLISAKGLEKATNIIYADLSNNAISDTSALINIIKSGYYTLSLDLSNNQISVLDIPVIEYSFLNLSGNEISDISLLLNCKISKLVFDYSDEIDYASLSENEFYHVYVVDCPLDKQLEIKKMLGEYNTEFIATEEAILMNSESK